jgi:hypothetical protein
VVDVLAGIVVAIVAFWIARKIGEFSSRTRGGEAEAGAIGPSEDDSLVAPKQGRDRNAQMRRRDEVAPPTI